MSKTKIIGFICAGAAMIALLMLVLVLVLCVILKRIPEKEPVTESIESSDVTRIQEEVKKETKKEYYTPEKITGGLSELASEYEGREGTGEFNYGEALQKSLIFYEIQRSGRLTSELRCNWRGDSALQDGADAGLDLTGGLYDAGDHVKFNLPMAYTASTLSWSVYEDYESYEESGQLAYILETIRWIDDYLIKCHPQEDVFYYQVADGAADHSWWGPAEVLPMGRPSYKVDRGNPGATVSAAAAAALASGYVIFADEDPEYAKECLSHAKALFEFANTTRSDAGYTAANGFYSSHSGFYDELAWAGVWLNIATGDSSYLSIAEECFGKASKDYKWTHCWDDVSLGTAVLMAEQSDKREYANHVEKCLDYWTTGINGERITYTPKGLAWLDSWGCLRYSTTTAFVAAVYSDLPVCTLQKKQIYHDFAVEQINYALGSTGFSYQIGFGKDYPQNPHHRTAQGSYSNNMNEPGEFRHTLYGALVGGPDSNDQYSDEVSNYVNNEVACDYNAGFTGALAHLYKEFGGKTLVGFGAVEEIPGDELCVNACVNAQGADYTEIKAVVMNKTAWPARKLQSVSLRYFMDLSELYDEGKTVEALKLSSNYSQGGEARGIYPWDEQDHIYYAEISFGDTVIYPGGQDSYKKEVQFRITSSSNWNAENDFSYTQIGEASVGQPIQTTYIALYEGEELIYGMEPLGEGVVIQDKEKTFSENTEEISKEETKQQDVVKIDQVLSPANDLMFSVENHSVSGDGATISLFLKLKNMGNEEIDLSQVRLEYYFTKDCDEQMNFWCDYASVSGSAHEAVTDLIKAEIKPVSGKGEGADSKIIISMPQGKNLNAGEELGIQIRVARQDWGNMNLSNDFSAGGADKIPVYYNNMLVLGELPQQ